jgi:hypothetical protein
MSSKRSDNSETDTDSGSSFGNDDDYDSTDFGSESDSDSDIPDPRDTPSKRLTQQKNSIQGRIKSARNWVFINILIFIIIVAIFSILYSLGYMSFDTGFNSSAT